MRVHDGPVDLSEPLMVFALDRSTLSAATDTPRSRLAAELLPGRGFAGSAPASVVRLLAR